MTDLLIAAAPRGLALSKGVEHSDLQRATAFGDLYSRYSDWLARRIRIQFGSDEADDIAQDAWLSISRLQSLSAIRHPRAFLLRVARNAALTQRRRGAVKAAGDVTASRGRELLEADQLETVFIRQVILSLPQPLRDVFVLSRFGGLTNEQIAEQLGIRPKTVEWRMTKALAHCAAQYRR